MFNIGDLVMMPADKQEEAVYGLIVGRQWSGLIEGYYYEIDWFDGENSTECASDIIKVENNG